MKPSTAHQLLAGSTGTAIEDWSECPGPDQKGETLTAWFVRRSKGNPDIYAVASGDAEHMAIELIPAEPDELDAFAVIRGVFAKRPETVTPDIECGVVFNVAIEFQSEGPTP